MSWGWFDKLFPFRKKDPPFRIPLIRTIIGKFRKSRIKPLLSSRGVAAPSSSKNQNRENWIDLTPPILPLSEFPFSPSNHLNQFHPRKDGPSYTKNHINQTEEKKKETPFTSTVALNQNFQPSCVSSVSSSSSSVGDGLLSSSSLSSSSTSIFFVHNTNQHPSTEPTDNDTIGNQIQNEEEITTYLSHLDEPTTIIVINNNTELKLEDNNNNNTILSDPTIDILQEQKNVDIENPQFNSDPVVRIPIKDAPPQQKEKNYAKAVSCTVSKPVAKVKIEDKRLKDGRDGGGTLVKEKVWANIDTIFKHFGHTFLERVSHAIMLLECTRNRRLSRKLSRSDVLDMLTKPKNGRLIPKIIIMIDDPPKSLEKNCSLGRLLCVKLYLLQAQFFVVPCFDLPIQTLQSMTNRLTEDKSSGCPNFKMAYNFILELGFSTLLRRNDADVIVFDGDWNNHDVGGLINDAEKSGHELMFMKNHQGIKRRAFVNVIISRIQTKLDEFEELKATESQTSSYTPHSKRSKTSDSPQNKDEQTRNPKSLDVLRQYNSGIIRLSHNGNENNDNPERQETTTKERRNSKEQENHYSRLQPYYAFMNLDPETVSKVPVVDSSAKKTAMDLDNINSTSSTSGTIKPGEENPVENNNYCNIQLQLKRRVSGVRRTQSWS